MNYYFITYSQRRKDRDITYLFSTVIDKHPFLWEMKMKEEYNEQCKAEIKNDIVIITHLVMFQEITKAEYDYYIQNCL